MKQNALTIITPIKPGCEQELQRLLTAINDDLRERQRSRDHVSHPVARRGPLIHFTAMRSLHFAAWVMLPAIEKWPARLLFESNFDGPSSAHLDELIAHGSGALDRIYAQCTSSPEALTREPERFKQYLLDHRLAPAASYVAFPGRSLSDIRNGTVVAAAARRHLDDQARDPLEQNAPSGNGSASLTPEQILTRQVHYFRRAARLRHGKPVSRPVRPLLAPVNQSSLRSRYIQNLTLLTIPALLFAPILFVLCLITRLYERREARTDAPPDPTWHQSGEEIFAGMDPSEQNHMCTLATVKPSRFRLFMLKLVLRVANLACKRIYLFGKLGPLATIHFARWILLDDNRHLLFLSNYDGVWNTYLGDFADQGYGVTAIWSNTLGFPATRFLFGRGARDVTGLNRQVREHLVPTQVFYRAYRLESVQSIQVNLRLRDRLAAALCEHDRMQARAARTAVTVDRADIQGVVTSGYNHLNHARFVLLRVLDGNRARAWLDQVIPLVRTAAHRPPGQAKPRASFNLAFTLSGFEALGIPRGAIEGFTEEFVHGMTRPGAARLLGDTGDSAPDKWQFGQPGRPCDLLLMLYGDSADTLDEITAKTCDTAMAQAAFAEIFRQDCFHAAGDPTEPFGFRDGIAQPAVIGLTHQPPWRVEELIRTGEFLFGYDNEYRLESLPPSIASAHDPGDLLPGHAEPRRGKAFGRNGCYLVLRKLEQDVPAFGRYINEQARGADGEVNEHAKELIAAKLVGRWRSGAPLVLSPARDLPALGGDNRLNNSFLYRASDADGHACPIGSHIRRANPRDALDFSPARAFELSKRHRIIRRGRKYAEPPVAGADGARQGLFFIALNADIGRQFEFIQQAWIGNPTFMGLPQEKDPIIGENDGKGRFTIQSKPHDRRLRGLERFVTVRGGAYFFLPGIATLRFLAADREPSRMTTAAAPTEAAATLG